MYKLKGWIETENVDKQKNDQFVISLLAKKDRRRTVNDLSLYIFDT